MARVHERKARKDYPAQGIKKGDTYYTWKTRVTVGKSYMGQVHRSLTRPLTTSSSAYEQALAEIDKAFDSVEDAEGLREIAGQIRDLGEEEQGKFDNMPEGLQQGDTGQMLEERASNCSQWADDVDTAADELETKLNDLQEEEDGEQAAREAWDEYDAAAEAWDEDSGDPEPEEPEDADPRNRSFDDERAELVAEAVEEARGACPN